MRTRSVVGALLLSLVIIGVATAQDIPLTNWPAPSSYTPSGRLAAMGDLTQAIPFVAVSPCRVYDSRNSSILAAAGTRVVPMDGGTCALPAGAAAYSIQITTFGSVASASYYFVTVYPAGATRPTVSTMNFLGGSQTTTAAIVPAGNGYDITVYSNVTTHFVIDVNGYFGMPNSPATKYLDIVGELPGGGVIFAVNSSAVSGSAGLNAIASGAGDVYGVKAFATGATGADAAGVMGVSGSNADTSGVYGLSGSWAHGSPSFNLGGVGVKGRGDRGLIGWGTGMGAAGVLVDDSTGGTINWAALGFSAANALYVVGNGTVTGNLGVTGTLSKGGGSFKIDHPLDPENKYLYHSFVESPDMMNIYNGNIELDSTGRAIVQMPEWFDALNRDFRYQLTAIGAAALVYVEQELADNQFVIAGGKPGMKVSWQVTGVRRDRFAEINRIPVEQEKPEKEKGLYLHPEAFGKPLTMSIEAAEDKPEIEQMLREREAKRQAREQP